MFGLTPKDIKEIHIQLVTDIQETYAKEVSFLEDETRTIDMLKKYVSYFNHDFMAATGNEEALKGLTRQTGIVFDKVILDDAHPDHYAVEHSTSIVLINPRGAIQAIFTAPHDATALTNELAAIYRAYRKEK